MEYQIKLTSAQLQECSRHAQAIVDYYAERFGSAGSGQYGHNKLSGNILGVKCEMGVSSWLEARGIHNEQFYKDFVDQKCDLSVGSHIIEVKGIKPYQWARFKRMIPPSQLHRYVKKNAIIVWALALDAESDAVVTIKGWNWAADVQEKGIRVQTICDNIWLRDDSDMRPLSTLIQLLERQKQ